MKKISLIIPVYNVEDYLPKCLDSVLCNDYPNLEIICIDDGSTDHSAAILQHYAEKDPRFRIIQQESKGVSAARNVGLSAATGELIAFLDADDWLHPRFFQVLAYYQKIHDADIVVSERQHVFPGDQVVSQSIDNWERGKYRVISGREMMRDHMAKAFVWGRLFRRELLDGQRFPEGIALGEDRMFNLSLVSSHPNMRVLRLPQRMYYYVSRENSAVGTATTSQWLTLASEILNTCESTQSQQNRQLYLTEAFKLTFSARYTCLRNCESATKPQIDDLLHRCLAELQNTPEMPAIRKLAYRTIACFPEVYQLLRIPKAIAMARKTNRK